MKLNEVAQEAVTEIAKRMGDLPPHAYVILLDVIFTTVEKVAASGLTPAEQKLLGVLLDDYSNKLGNAGCNDFEFRQCTTRVNQPGQRQVRRELFTAEEKAELAAAYAAYQMKQEPYEPVEPNLWGGLDFVFLDMLRDKLGLLKG